MSARVRRCCGCRFALADDQRLMISDCPAALRRSASATALASMLSTPLFSAGEGGQCRSRAETPIDANRGRAGGLCVPQSTHCNCVRIDVRIDSNIKAVLIEGSQA